MKSFKDTKDRTWEISINVSALKAVKAALDVDLNRLVEDDLIVRFANDPALLGDTLYILCKKQCEELGIDDFDFGCGLAGDALDNATKAFLEEVVNFTRSPDVRANLTAILAEIEKTESLTNKMIAQKLATGIVEKTRDRELKRIEKMIDSQLMNAGDSSTDAPESSDSTPAHSLSAS